MTLTMRPDLTDQVHDLMTKLAIERSPKETGGVLVLDALVPGGTRLIELPNRTSANPEATYALDPADLEFELKLLGFNLEPDADSSRPTNVHFPALVAWHTHPSGRVGPSRTDLESSRSLLAAVPCKCLRFLVGSLVEDPVSGHRTLVPSYY